MKIYIAGKITGEPNYKEKFDIAATSLEAQGHIVLNLSDTGIGMTPEQQSRAFYRGVSFQPGGNGIGLSIVRKIAHELHIKIHIDSAPNQGTTFTLIFPAYEQKLNYLTHTEALTK